MNKEYVKNSPTHSSPQHSSMAISLKSKSASAYSINQLVCAFQYQ